MICVYPVEIEAVDEEGNPIFKLKTFDEYSATLTVNSLISPTDVDEFCQALQKSVTLLELKNSDDHA